MRQVGRRKPGIASDEAQTIALQALAFLAEDPRRLTRFMSLTGLTAADLRAAAETLPVQLAVLEHLATDESLLLVFTSSNGCDPESVTLAAQTLSQASGHHAPD